MTRLFPHVACLITALSLISTASVAADLTNEFDARHKTCLEDIAVDAQDAFEKASQWQDQGGGRRAKHCVAMALFALGHEDEAAFRLDNLAAGADGGSTETRVKHYSEAANFWLSANEPEKAYASASAGLKLEFDHLDLRIARARAYALSGRYDYAETDLTSVLTLDPAHAPALRYRADARFKQDRADEALRDIEAALNIDPTSVETALLRGKIREFIRLEDLAAVVPPQSPDE
jgi:tetratricopeptide (TPR) repeat protein